MTLLDVKAYGTLEAGDVVNCAVSAAVVAVVFGVGLVFRGWGVAVCAGVGMFVLSAAFNLPIVVESRYFEEVLLALSVLCLLAVNEVVGSVRLVTKFLEKVFKGKMRLAFPFAGATFCFALAALSGQGLLCIGFFPLFIEVAKDINLLPTKVVVPSVVAAVLGDLTSPISYTMTMYSKIAYMMGSPGDEMYWNDGFKPVYTLMDASLALIPSAYIGVLAATGLSLLMGKKLSENAKFKSRLVTGDCHCNYPERYLSEPSLAAMARNCQVRAAKRDGVVLSGDNALLNGPETAVAEAQDGNNGLKQKPLPYFSQVSLLSEGDYVYTSPLVSKPSDEIVDINNRTETPGSPFRPGSGQEKNLDSKPTATSQQQFEPDAANVKAVAYVAQSYKPWQQWLAIGVTLIAGIWGILYAILHDYHLYVIPVERHMPSKLAYAGGFFAASIIVMAATRTSGSRFQYCRYFPRGVTGLLAGIACHVMVSSWAAHWLPKIGANHVEHLAQYNAALIGEAVVAALMAGSWHSASIMNMISTTINVDELPRATVPTQRLWFTSIMVSAGAIVLPWHTIALCAIEFDDTRSIRAGYALFDNYITPLAVVGVAVASAVCFPIASAIFDDTRIARVSKYVLHNWNVDDSSLGFSWWGLKL